MAFSSSIGDTKIMLVDGFPGQAQSLGLMPTVDASGNFLTNASYFNVATKGPWPNMTKIQLIDPIVGPVTFIYSKLQSVSAAHACVAGELVGLYISSGVLSGYLSSKTASSEVLIGGPAALAIGTVTEGYWAWWQCAGRPAIGLVPALDSDTLIGTDGSVAAVSTCSLIANDNAPALCVTTAGKQVVAYAGGADA